MIVLSDWKQHLITPSPLFQTNNASRPSTLGLPSCLSKVRRSPGRGENRTDADEALFPIASLLCRSESQTDGVRSALSVRTRTSYTCKRFANYAPYWQFVVWLRQFLLTWVTLHPRNSCGSR